MLAQLADGEFVSRAAAVRGAGIVAGASVNNKEEQRKVAMLSTALQNEALAEKGGDNARTLIEFIAGLF